MEDNTHYYKDPPKLILELMQDTLGDKYQYFLGSPLSLSQGAYPCIVIQADSSANSTNGAPTGQDIVTESINIHILVIDQFAAASKGTEQTTMRNLYQLVQGRNPQTKEYMTGTILYALRSHNDLDTVLIDSDVAVNYDVSPTDQGKIVVEAIVSIKTQERVSVSDRVYDN